MEVTSLSVQIIYDGHCIERLARPDGKLIKWYLYVINRNECIELRDLPKGITEKELEEQYQQLIKEVSNG